MNAEGEEKRTLAERIVTPIVASRPGAWFYVNVSPHIDRPLLRLTGGRLSTGGIGRVGMLLVKGAKSGQLRRTPLVYTRNGGTVLLVASRGGDVRNPAWYRNVMANPEVSFVADGEERHYLARELSGPERDRAWKLVNRTYAGYAAYQARAGSRQIPVISLEPRVG